MDEVWRKYFDPRVLEKLRGTSLRTRWSATGSMAGMHRASRSGQAVEFSEHRQYTPGEDLRQLDWKVLGRTDKYYLRQREDETTMRCHLLVDRSGSMSFRSESSESDKLTFAFRVAASLAFVASESNDSSSLTCLGESVQPLLGPGTGSGHLMAMAGAMNKVSCDRDASIADKLMSAIKLLPSGGLVILISDLFDDPDALLKAFRGIRASGRSMIVIQVVDRSELEFPFGDTVQFDGLEDEPALTVDSQGVRNAYREEYRQHQQELESGCKAAEIQFWTLTTDEMLQARMPELLSSV